MNRLVQTNATLVVMLLLAVAVAVQVYNIGFVRGEQQERVRQYVGRLKATALTGPQRPPCEPLLYGIPHLEQKTDRLTVCLFEIISDGNYESSSWYVVDQTTGIINKEE